MSEFLAEAQVLIRPNMAGFATELQTELTAAIKSLPPQVVPIVPAVTGASAAGAAGLAAANAEVAASAQAAGAESAKAALSTRELSNQQKIASKSAELLAAAQAEVVGASSAAAAASIAFTRSQAALAAANRELGAARQLGNATAIAAAEQSVRLAEAQHAEALTALEAARAQQAHAASLGQVRTAGIAGAASMLGLRGAVLTAGAAFLGATIAIQSARKAIVGFAEFQRELNVFRTVAQATDTQMKQVSATAKALGRDITLPGVAAQDAAVAMTELAKAGLSVDDALAATRGTLQLATAAQIDNAKATELVANTLNSFSLAGREAVRVADLLAGAANASQGSIEDMGIALRQSAGAASQIGLSVDETVTLLAALARAGLAGSDAGTTLRVALLRLVAPTAAARTELEKYNIALRDPRGNVRVEALFELEAALRKVSKAEADQARVAIFGQNAFRVSALLGRLTTQEYTALEEAVTRAGQAQELASAQTQGLSGSFEQLRNSASSAGLLIGGLASGPLQVLLEGTAGGISDVAEFGDQLQTLGSDAADATPGVRTAGDAVQDLATKAVKASTTIALLGPTLFAVKVGLDQFKIGAKEAGDELSAFDRIAQGVIGTLDELGAALRKAAGSIKIPKDSSFNVRQIEGIVRGFDEREVRARIAGSNDAILAVLREEQAFLEDQLDREFVKRRPALRRKLETALLGVISDIDAIQRQEESAAARSAAEAKRRAEELARARREADEALLDALGLRREDAERAIGIAASSGNVAQQLRRLDAFQALIQKQIAKVRNLIKDEKLRKDTIRQLRIALNESRREEAALRAEQRANAAAEREESIRLLIENAQITQNRAKEIALQKKLVRDLERQVRESKLRGNALQELKNELARERARLKELQGEVGGTKDAFKELAFEFLQTQQGFAANLFGNLVPAGATGGLVSPDFQGGATFGDKVGQTAALIGQSAGPSRVQTSTEIDILREMLMELKAIRAGNSHPEAHFQKRSSGGAMEIM